MIQTVPTTEPLIMGPDPNLESEVPGMHIWGWMSNHELDWLTRTAATMRSVVEVGSLHGRSAFALLTGCPGPVYCIDPWDDEGGHCYPSFMGYCGHFRNLRAIRGLSPAAASQVPRAVEMVFLDGDHSYDALMADLKVWTPKTTKLICGHDFQNANGGYPDVERAVHEVFGARVTVPVGAIWAVTIDKEEPRG